MEEGKKEEGERTGVKDRRVEEEAACIEILMGFVHGRLEWGEPYAGKGTDTFVLSNNGNRLTQVSEMEFDDVSKNCTYKTVYSRHHGDRS